MKSSQIEYDKFYNLFNNYIKSITDPLLLNLMKVVEICIEYDPDKRLTSDELTKILQNLSIKNPSSIELEHSILLRERTNSSKEKVVPSFVHLNIIQKLNENFQTQINAREIRIQQLEEYGAGLSNQLNIIQTLLNEKIIREQ